MELQRFPTVITGMPNSEKHRADPWSPLRLAAGWLLIPLGLVITPLPIPLGILMILIGLGLLVRDSRGIRSKLRRLRARFPGISARLSVWEDRSPRLIRGLLRRTDPRRRVRSDPVDSDQC
jgi:hypothetical protein